jgi:hypothetical protein
MFVRNKTPKICLEAIKQNHDAVIYAWNTKI